MSTDIADHHRAARRPMDLIRNREGFILDLISRYQLIAHLGCTDAPYTELRLKEGKLLHESLVNQARKSHASVVGFDVDCSGVELLRKAIPESEYVCCSIADGLPRGEHQKYPLVIAGEVLEHVDNIAGFLAGCRELLAPNGLICVTVPNACSPKIGIRALAGREVVHPDHRVYFGPRTLERSLEIADLSVKYMATYLAEPGPVGGRLNWVLRMCHTARRGPIGEGIIALADRAEGADGESR